MSINEMEIKIRELRNLQTLIEEAEAEAEALKDQIKAEMGDREELRVGEYRVTYKTITSSRFDTTAFRKAMPDVAAKFTKSTTSLRFTVA